MSKLYRIRKKSWIGGVCEGLGKYTDIPPDVWRIIFVILYFSNFPALIMYIILWIIIPEK